MRNILFDVLEINIVMALVIVLLRLFAGKIRKRYGAIWLKLMWIVLMVRLLIPYNFSLPATEFRLFNMPGFEQEIAENAGDQVLNNYEQNVWPKLNGDAMQSDGVSQNVPANNADPYVQGDKFGGEGSQMSSEGGAGDTAVMNPENAESNAGGVNPENAEGNAGGMNSENTGSDAKGVGYAGVGSTNHIVTDVADGAEDARKPGVFRYTDILLYIWLIGIGGSAVYHVAVYLVMRRTYMKDLEPVQNASLQEEIDKLQNKYLGQKKLTVYESKQVQSPLITGILHPKLIIPSYEGDWNADELELITAHELCHYHKKDLWLKMLMLAVTCFNWFNPAVYMMKKQFYYDMELVCDESVMRGRSKEEKETYAKILMTYAGKGRRNYTFMSGLAAGSKFTKNRIYHIWEDGQKKKGVVVFATVLVGFIGIGLFVSCGYKPGEVGNSVLFNGAFIQGVAGWGNPGNNDAYENIDFNYNNEHNKMVRVYDDKTYVARNDGIYVMEGGELKCLYENSYNYHRGFDIYDDAIYFTGSVPGGEERQGTVYRMDLDTYEVKDVLPADSEVFYGLYTITIHEGNLYTANTEGYIGFALDEKGMATDRLDETAEDFLYKEFNEIAKLEMEKYVYDPSTAEGQEIREQLLQAYYPAIDYVACAEMLDGKYVVKQYNDESTYNVFLVDENENYTLLSQYGYNMPVLVTEQGIYYSPDWRGDIYYMTYDGSVNQCILDTPGNWGDSVYMITYDAQYLYFTTEITVGGDVDNITKTYIVRVPRNGGKYEAVYEVQGDYSPYIHLPGECGIDSEYMYFYEQYDGNSFIKLEPVEIAEAELHSFKQAEVACVPEVQIHSFENAKELGQSWEIYGSASGTPATWHIIEIEGIEYFYVEHELNGQMVTELYNYAISGEQYSLANGIRVGDPAEEIFTRYPNMAKIYFQDEYITLPKGCLGWSGATYPHSNVGWDENYEYINGDYNWTNQFDYAIVGNVVRDNDIEAPLYVALLVKDEFVVAITFYSPTDGPGIFDYETEIAGNAEESYLTQVEDPVYRNLITEMLDTGKFPAGGSEWNGKPYDSFYAIKDVDMDNKEELVINWVGANFSVIYIYDYDRETKEAYIQHDGYNDMVMYDGGYIIEANSHNQGRSSLDNFWPYSIKAYDSQNDVYEHIANIDAWTDNCDWFEPEFPESKDADGDGVVYYSWTAENWNNPTDIMDNAEYKQFYEKYTSGNPLIIEWKRIISEDEYYELYPQPEANG